MNERLEERYFDAKKPGAYAGVDTFYKSLKREGKIQVGGHQLRRWLQNQDTYSLHRPLRKTFQRNRVITSGPFVQFDIDLCDILNISEYNDNIKFLLIAIDVFSRYAIVVPTMNKTAKVVKRAMKKVIEESDRKPFLIRTDRGKEFRNKTISEFFKLENIKHFVTHNADIKANYAERFLRTLRNMMSRYFTRNRTYRYVEVLQDLVYNYNHRVHRSLRHLSPAEINPSNQAEVWLRQFVDSPYQRQYQTSGRKFRFKLKDLVRVSLAKTTFQKEHTQNWTEELFELRDRERREGIPIYRLKDLMSEEVEGTFYEPELQKVEKKGYPIWKIDEILKTKWMIVGRGRKHQRVKQLFVSWLGYPTKFNSWIEEKEIEQ